jgi:hypothetical protein
VTIEISIEFLSEDFVRTFDLIIYDSDWILSEIESNIRTPEHYRHTRETLYLKDISDFTLQLLRFASMSIVVTSIKSKPSELPNHPLSSLVSKIITNCLRIVLKPADVQSIIQVVEDVIVIERLRPHPSSTICSPRDIIGAEHEHALQSIQHPTSKAQELRSVMSVRSQNTPALEDDS